MILLMRLADSGLSFRIRTLASVDRNCSMSALVTSIPLKAGNRYRSNEVRTVVLCDFRYWICISSNQVSANSLNRGDHSYCTLCLVALLLSTSALGLFGKYLPYSKVPIVVSASIFWRIFSRRLRLVDVDGSDVCSRQRSPPYRKSKYKLPVSGRSTILPMCDRPPCHRNCLHAGVRKALHVPFNGLPDIQNLSTTKGANVVDSLMQHRVFEPLPDCPIVVFDFLGQLASGEIGL